MCTGRAHQWAIVTAIVVALSTSLAYPTSASSRLVSARTVTKDMSWIQLDDLTPAVVPTAGKIVVTGTLHNGSGSAWRDVAVQPETSSLPLRTSTNIRDAASLDPALVHLGSPIQNLAQKLGEVPNGSTRRFVITVPRNQLRISGSPGTYWFGVTPTSMDRTFPATLTARTFLPLLPSVNSHSKTDVSLVVPLRGDIARNPNGALNDPRSLTALVSPSGRLGRIATFGHAAGNRPLTWLVDPAFLDLVGHAGNGTAAYGFDRAGTALPKPPAPSSSTTTPATPAASGNAIANTQANGSKEGAWLADMLTLLKANPTYALPYGDPDVRVLNNTGSSALVRNLQQMSASAMQNYGIDAYPAQIINGTASAAASFAQNPNEVLFTQGPTQTFSGPGPIQPVSALNVRQRILAEASLHASETGGRKLTVVLPPDWDPVNSTHFFSGLDQPFLTLVPLTPASTTGPLSTKGTVSPQDRNRASATTSLLAIAKTISQLRGHQDAASQLLTRQLTATAVAAVSAVPQQRNAVAAAIKTRGHLADLLSNVGVEGTPFVTLSGSDGVITVTLHNDLNVPITIGMRQVQDRPGNTISVKPTQPTTLDPGERSTIRINVSTPRVAVQQVTLSATMLSGETIGSPLSFTVRSSSVGVVVWAVLIAVGLVLALVVIQRIRHRLTSGRAASKK